MTDGREPGWACPVCGYGYCDAGRTHEELRMLWIKNGMKFWSTVREKPKNWNPFEQLANLLASQIALHAEAGGVPTPTPEKEKNDGI